jgi:predicted glycoside hydrolase/deacetylase ChbG (UPF0249 family)
MRYVIVNADDFGASTGTNRGIVECHTRGVLTSTSMMVTGAAVEEAMELSREHPQLAIGLHWDVIGEDEREFSLEDHDAVKFEFASQLDRFHELMGRGPTHVDSHRHMHRDEEIDELFAELVAPLGVPLRGHSDVRFVGNFYAQWEWGVTDLEHVSVETFEQILREEVREGWTELSCHPGYVSDDYTPMYRHEREAELRTLTDPRVRAAMDEMGMSLQSYATYAALSERA